MIALAETMVAAVETMVEVVETRVEKKKRCGVVFPQAVGIAVMKVKSFGLRVTAVETMVIGFATMIVTVGTGVIADF
jgi:hypothetical protein